MKINYFKELKTKIGLLPTDLKWLFWFSVFLFFLSTFSLIFAREQLYEQIVPYTGWSLGIMCLYLITILIAVLKNSKETNDIKHVSLRNVRRRIFLILVIYLIFGIYDWFDLAPEFYIHTNPYLRYDPLRPIFTIFLPLLWILIAVAPLMRDLFRKRLKSITNIIKVSH